MVWSPSYGAGYPFGQSAGRLQDLSATDTAKLDTNGDGQLTAADDPYEPYWPGDASVDWVGMSMYYFGKGKATEAAGRDVPLTDERRPGVRRGRRALRRDLGLRAAAAGHLLRAVRRGARPSDAARHGCAVRPLAARRRRARRQAGVVAAGVQRDPGPPARPRCHVPRDEPPRTGGRQPRRRLARHRGAGHRGLLPHRPAADRPLRDRAGDRARHPPGRQRRHEPAAGHRRRPDGVDRLVGRGAGRRVPAERRVRAAAAELALPGRRQARAATCASTCSAGSSSWRSSSRTSRSAVRTRT